MGLLSTAAALTGGCVFSAMNRKNEYFNGGFDCGIFLLQVDVSPTAMVATGAYYFFSSCVLPSGCNWWSCYVCTYNLSVRRRMSSSISRLGIGKVTEAIRGTIMVTNGLMTTIQVPSARVFAMLL